MNRATQNDHSSAAEKAHLCRDSLGKTLFDVSVVNAGAADLYLHILDSTDEAPAALDVDTFNPATESFIYLSDPAWQTGTPCRFTAGTTVPTPLVVDRTYYLINATGGSYKVAHSLAAAINGDAIAVEDDAVGVITIHVADWIQSAPLLVNAGIWERLSFDPGRQFTAGIYLLVSTAAATIVLPGGNVAYFDANYST